MKYNIVFILTLFIAPIAQAANQLVISIEDPTHVASLTLDSFHDPDIIWKDENGNTSALPETIKTTTTTAFYGNDFQGYFDLDVVYNIEENNNLTDKSIAIDMDEQSCYINGAREISFTTNKYTYHLTATSSPFIPDNVTCNISIKVEQNAGQTPFIQVSIHNQSQSSPTPSEPPKFTGILTQGTVTLGENDNKTTCSAANFNDCNAAASQNITASNVSPLYTFTADPANWLLEGELRYAIHDPELTTPIDLIVTLQDGQTLLEQCIAQISPISTGVVQYEVQTTALDNNHCRVTLIRALKPLPDSPTMQLIINNQLERTIGSAYSFSLKQNQVQITEGILNVQPIDIPVNQTHTLLLSALNGIGSNYQGTLYYAFDDYQMSGVPTGLQINLNKSKSEDINRWCQAGITGWNESYRLYQVNTEVTGDAANAICNINITSTDNPKQPTNYSLVPVDAIPTEGIRHWEEFTIDGQTYLAAANSASKNSDYINQNIFRFIVAPINLSD